MATKPAAPAPLAVPPTSGSAAAVAYDTAASQPMGALSTGMGYDPLTVNTTTLAAQRIGGAAFTIGYEGVAP